MRKILIILLFLAANAIVKGQYIYKIKADSVLITNDSCNAELNLENHTRDTLGFLYNRGKGRTEFRRAIRKINDSLYIIGSDTLNINSGRSSLTTTGAIRYINNSYIGLTSGIGSNGTAASTSASTSNVFIGDSSGNSNATGHNNVFIGTQTGYSNTIGQMSVFIGWLAGKYNTTGGDNIFIGDAAGYKNSTGRDNVAIGDNAGKLNTSGHRNVNLGAYAGLNNTSGFGNVNIGYLAGAAETGNNKFYLGTSTDGTDFGAGGSTRVTLMYGDFATGQLQVNAASGTTLPTITPSAQFEVKSTSKGFLPPTLTASQRLAISTPAQGLIVYQTDSVTNAGEGLYYYSSVAGWLRMASFNTAAYNWKLTGNAGTDPASNFLGTTDSTDLVFRTNNIERMRVASSGNVGIGTSTYLQTHKLAVAGKGLFADTLFAPKVFALPNNNLSGINTSWSKSLITTAYEGNSDDGITINGASNSGAFRPIIIGHRGRGTLASPTDVQNGDWLFGIVAAGTYNNSRQTPAAIEFIVDSIPNGTNNIPTSVNFMTGTNGGNRVTRLRVGSNGNVLIGTTTDQGFRLDVNGTARVQTIPYQAGRDTVLSYDPSTKQIIATKPSLPGTLIGVRILSSGTSYTPTTGTTAVFIELVGAGGGGGGVSGANNNVGAAGGGGGGSLLQKYITSVGSGPFTYAIGSAGTAGANTGGTGGNGGNTTITINSVTYTAPGGSGGVGQTAGTSLAVTAGGAGGSVATNGDVNGSGAPGGYATRLSGSVGVSGAGGSTPYGGGGSGLTALGNGNNGTGYGGGGGGGLSTSNLSKTGGTGASGVIIIYEYK